MYSTFLNKNSIFHSKGFLLFSSLIFCFIALVIRAIPFGSVDNVLWAEDGVIFINQAHQMGFSSLWNPYAGYLHLYPRLITFVASFFPLSIFPYVSMFFWFLAFFCVMAVLVDRLSDFLVYRFSYIFLSFFIIFQPHSGEVLYTITNAQWVLQLALIFYVVFPNKKPYKIYDYFIVCFLSLTGPFIMLLLPVLVLRRYLFNDYADNKIFYFSLVCCSLVQIFYVLKSGRLESGSIDLNIYDWLKSFYSFFSFGAGRYDYHFKNTFLVYFVEIFSIYFWLSFISLAFIVIKRIIFFGDRELFYCISLLILSACLLYAAGLSSAKSNPEILSPVAGGARYFFAPYALIFLTVFLLMKESPKVSCSMLFCLIFIEIIQIFNTPTFVGRPNLQYQAFASFSKIKNIIIPIAPQTPSFPGWHIDANQKNIPESKADIFSFKYDSNDFLHEIELEKNSNLILAKSVGADPYIVFRNKINCTHNKFVGIEIKIWREQEGWSQLFWSNNSEFSEQFSMRRYYLSGDSVMQFAFQNNDSGLFIRFDPSEKVGSIGIHSLNVFCLN